MRSGFFTDAKHRERIGQAVWLYGYLHIYADRRTGRLTRNYQTIADEIGTSTKTIQRWMEVLKRGKYVEIQLLQHGISVQITKWKPIKNGSRLDSFVQSEKGVQVGHFGG